MSEPSAPLKSLTSSETNSLVSEMTGGEREEGEVTCQVPLLSTSQIGEGEAEAVPTSVPKISLNNNLNQGCYSLISTQLISTQLGTTRLKSC